MDKRLVGKILNWCSGFYGKSEFEHRPLKTRVYKHSKGKNKGLFDSGNATISIYLGHHESVIDLITTVIHEYVHYLQPVALTYDALEQYYGLPNHPLERDANLIAVRDRWICYRHLNLDNKLVIS